MSEADVIQRVRRIALEEAKKSAAGALDRGPCPWARTPTT